MDHGGEAARPTTVESTHLGMPGTVQKARHIWPPAPSKASSALPPRTAPAMSAPRSAEEVPVVVFHREPGPGVVDANISASSLRQQGSVDVMLLGLLLPDGVVPVHGNHGYSALQLRPTAESGVVLAAQLPGGGGGSGAVCGGDYTLLPRPGAGHGEVIVDLLPDGAGHGEAFFVVGQLPCGSGAVYGDYGHFALRPRPGAGHSEVVVDLLPNGAGHGEVFVDLLPGGGDAVHDDYGVDMVYGDPGMLATHLGRMLAFIGISASSMAVNALAAGPGSPAVAFHLFLLLLAGLFLVILHVLRV